MRKFLRKLNPSRYLVLRSTYERDIASTELVGRLLAARAYSQAHNQWRRTDEIFDKGVVKMADFPYVDYVPR